MMTTMPMLPMMADVDDDQDDMAVALGTCDSSKTSSFYFNFSSMFFNSTACVITAT
jgi:hypothetical protein